MTEFPAKPGFYDRSELAHLSTAVGYPADFLVAGFEAASTTQPLQTAHSKLSQNRRVSDKVILELLSCKHMQSRLEKVFNSYSADFNKKFFAKVLSLLKHKRLSFAEISDARIAFDLYSNEGGGGMPASTDTVLQALNMLDRVMSPIRLESEILKQQKVVDLPSCIQVYEFLDLVIRCARFNEVEREMEQTSNLSDSSDIPDFDEILMTKEKQVLAYLDKQYRDVLFRKKEKTTSSTIPVSVAKRSPTFSHREKRVAHSLLQKRAFTPSLEYSQNQVFRARSGYVVLTGEQCHEIESLQASRISSRSGKRPATHSGMCSSPRHWKQGDGTRYHDKTWTPAPHRRPPSHHSMQSRSAPSLPLIQHPTRNSKEKDEQEDIVVEDLDEEISRICKASVHRASSALRESMSRIPLYGNREEKFTKVACKRTKPIGVRVHYHQPLVTKVDIERQQGLIDEIEWNELRRKRANQTTTPTSQSVL